MRQGQPNLQRLSFVLTPFAAGPVYFEYIGTGDANPDTVSADPHAIPVPASGPFYFIVFLLSDQVANPGGGQSTGDFRPVGLYEVGSDPAAGIWDSSGIQRLTKNRSPNVKVKYLAMHLACFWYSNPLHPMCGVALAVCTTLSSVQMQVMASIAGNTATTKWTGVSNVPAYVQSATTSLLSYYHNFSLAGFDIDYEESVVHVVNNQLVTDSGWLSAWCQIIMNLKQVCCRICYK